MILGQLIAAYMEKNRLSVRQTAGLIGIHYSTLHRILRGENTKATHVALMLTWMLSGNVKRK